jgi:preprotein translocase subunit SecE
MANEEIKNAAPAKATKTAVKREDNPKKGFFKSIAKWFREMKSELKKVVWPTPKQILNNTLVALVVMIAAAIVLWAFDSLAQAAVKALISLAG